MLSINMSRIACTIKLNGKLFEFKELSVGKFVRFQREQSLVSGHFFSKCGILKKSKKVITFAYIFHETTILVYHYIICKYLMHLLRTWAKIK